MYSVRDHQNLLIPKKTLLKIDDKDIKFKGLKNYQGLLLLENSSLIKCSYLAEDEERNLYTIKVYNFENKNSGQTFVKNVHNLFVKDQPFFPKIVEVIPEKEILQVLVIEKFVGCLSLRTFLDQAMNNDGLADKLYHGLILHKLLIITLDSLAKIEAQKEYHGFLNLSNICFKAPFPPNDNDIRTYIESMIQDFSLIIWDYEAHKYWETIATDPVIRKNGSLWKSIITKNGMMESPELKIEENGLLNLSIKYDVWMLGVILLQIVSFSDPKKSELFQEWNATWHQISYNQRAVILKELVEDPLLYKLSLVLFQDEIQRPLPSEIIKLDFIKEMKALLGIGFPIDNMNSQNIKLSYEVLMAGLSCNNSNIALGALDSLLEESIKEKDMFLNIFNKNAYLAIISRLKFVQKNGPAEYKQKFLEKGIKFLIKVLEHGGRTVINGFKVSGIISFILRAIENDLDQELLCKFLQYFGQNTTETFIHFVEKSGFVSKIMNSLKQNDSAQKSFYLNTSHFYKLGTLLEPVEILTEQELFSQLIKVPLVKRTDHLTLKILKKLLIQYGKGYTDQKGTKEPPIDSLYEVLFSWLFLRNLIIYSSCHSQCFAAILPKDMKVPSETGYYCKSCSQSSGSEILLCANCAISCHKGHLVSALGFQYFSCNCHISGECTKMLARPIPSYLLNQNENYLDPLKISFSKIPKNFKAETGKNIFLNIDGEIGTMVSSTPLCNIKPSQDTGKSKKKKSIPCKVIVAEKTCGYYEVEIKLGGFYDQNAVGFTSYYHYPKDEFAGYMENSIAYHGDDGTIYLNGNIVGQLCSFGSYDIIGCGITNFGTVFFTHNGVLLGEFSTSLSGSIFPVVSLRGKYSSVQTNFDGNFVFNYEDLKEIIAEKDYYKFISPLIMDSFFVHPEWHEIMLKLNLIKHKDWLEMIVNFVNDKKEKSNQQTRENETKGNEFKTIDEKSLDVLKELHSVVNYDRYYAKGGKEINQRYNQLIQNNITI